jgi:hypothetical protein
MAKIIHFQNDNMDMETMIKDILERVHRGQLEQIVIAAKQKDDYVLTAYKNCDLIDRQYLISHLQADVTYDTIAGKMDELVEYVDE